jgi:23S rRNA pseudouridine1911/1915/1917 synthase
MPRPDTIILADRTRIPILYEDRNVIAVDKPAGWLLVPSDWYQTSRNLQLAIESSIGAGDHWARSRSLRFLRFIHRLDSETSGVLLMAKHPGVLSAMSSLFEERTVEKDYMAVVAGIPQQREWICDEPLTPAEGQPARAAVDREFGKPAETLFRVLQTAERTALVTARPFTGRTHQIRLHLLACRLPVLGDRLYANEGNGTRDFPMALRAMRLRYIDPFTKRPVQITAPMEKFLKDYGFTEPKNGWEAAPDLKTPSSAARRPTPSVPPRDRGQKS